MHCSHCLMLAAGLLAVINATASATIYITHVHEDHTKITNNAYDGQVINDFSPGNNAFTTFDGISGFTSSLDSNGGVLSFTAGGRYKDVNGQNGYSTNVGGTIDFVVADSPLIATIGIASQSGSGIFGGSYTVTNLSTNDFWKWFVLINQNNAQSPTFSGGLTFPAAPGSYRLDFSGFNSPFMGFTSNNTMTLNLATTPEPAMLVALALPALAVLRRRR